MPTIMMRYMSISVVAKRLYLVQNDGSFGGVGMCKSTVLGEKIKAFNRKVHQVLRKEKKLSILSAPSSFLCG